MSDSGPIHVLLVGVFNPLPQLSPVASRVKAVTTVAAASRLVAERNVQAVLLAVPPTAVGAAADVAALVAASTDVPIIVVGGNVSGEDVDRLLELGAWDYVPQADATPDTLRRRLRSALRYRQMVDQRVAAENGKLADIFANIPAFICTLSGPEHVFESANPMYYQLVGQRDLIGRPVREALPELQGQGFFEPLDIVYRTGVPFTGKAMPVTLRPRRPGDEPQLRYVSIAYEPMRDGEGCITGVLAHGTDITEQRLTELALADRERQLRALIDNAPAYIYYKDTAGQMVDVNRNWAELVGATVDEVRGRPESDFFPAEVVARFAHIDREVLAHGRPLVVEERGPGRSGDERTYHSIKFPLFDEHGVPYALCGISTDVTEQRRAEEALRRSQEMLRRVFDSSVDRVETLDLAGTLLSMNARGLSLMEIEDVASVKQTDWVTLWHGSDKALIENALAVAKAGGIGHFEGTCITAGGTEKWFNVVISPISDAEGRPELLLAVARDVTDKHAADEMLRLRNAVLKAQNEASPDGILVVSPEGRVVSFNQRFVDLWKIPKSVVDAGDDDACLRVAAQRVADQEFFARRTSFFYENPMQAGADEISLADGRILERYTAPVRGEDGCHYGRVWCFREITDRRRAEDALRESEERYRLVLRATNEVLWDWDGASDELYWSDAMRTVFGFAETEVRTSFQWWIERLHPDDRDSAVRGFERVIAEGGDHYASEYRFRRGDGTYADVHDRADIVRDSTGRVVRMVGAMQDVTERRRAEFEVRESRERLLQLADAMPQMVWTASANGQSETFNRRWYEYTGLTPAEAAGDQWVRVVHPEDADATYQRWQRSVETGEPYEVEARFRRAADGTYRWHLARALPARDASGQILRWIGTCTDIEDQKNGERALRESEERFRTLVGNLPGAVYRCVNDAQWTMQYLSDAVLPLTGYPASDFIGNACRSFAEIIDGDDYLRCAKITNDAVARGASFELEYRIHHADGSIRWAYEKGRAVYDAAGHPVGLDGAIFDVTDLHRAREVTRELEALRMALAAHEQVLGVVGHELRTPLAATRAMAEFILTDGARETPEFDRFLQSIHAEVIRMSNMVNDLLEVARLNSGAARWNWGEVAVAQACDDALASIDVLIDKGRVSLAMDVVPPDLNMRGDADAVRRLVLNLVNNAAKFTKAGSIRVQAGEVRQDDARWIRLDVVDTGEGMTEETAQRVGEAFALNSGVVGGSCVKGSGLGLAICKGIVAAHGGTMTVASEIGVGTRITVLLRADLATAVASPATGGIIRRVSSGTSRCVS